MRSQSRFPIVTAAIIAAAFAVPPAFASFQLQNLGANHFEIPPDFATVNFAQSADSLSLSGSFSPGDTLAGLFLPGPQDWSLYSDFALRIALADPNPNVTFSLSFFSYNSEDPGDPYPLINTYSGFTLDAGSSPSNVPLTLAIPGSEDFSAVAGLQFTWDAGGSASVTLLDVVAMTGPAAPGGTFTASAPGGVRFINSARQAAIGAGATNWTYTQLPPGGTSWSVTSDSNAKTDLTAIDAQEVLHQVAQLPVTSWQYKHDPDRRHIGPMAQDFRAAFGLGNDDKSISTLDADGVALAALKGLIAELQTSRNRSVAQARRLSELEAEIRALRGRLPNALPPTPQK